MATKKNNMYNGLTQHEKNAVRMLMQQMKEAGFSKNEATLTLKGKMNEIKEACQKCREDAVSNIEQVAQVAGQPLAKRAYTRRKTV